MLTYISVLCTYLKAVANDEEGASAVEYGLILGLIAVAIIAVLILLQEELAGLFGRAADELGTAGAPAE